MTTQLTFCGGVGTVTGSMHLLQVHKTACLIDVGLFQGRREAFYKINSEFPFNPQQIDCCVISHAHIDHCGNFPTLVKTGFRGKAHTTPTTKQLCRYMLPDSGHIQEEDIKYVNKINRRKGLGPHLPLYTQKDAIKAIKQLRSLQYHKKFNISKNISLTFFDAGHILGSSIPTIDMETKAGRVRLAYAVDLGRPNLPYLREPEIPKDVNYLIMESTYGGRSRPSIKNAEQRLLTIIGKTIKRGGKVLIPAFALERTQEVLYFIGRLLTKKQIRDIPIYVDSPLAVNLTTVFRENWEYFDEETKKLFRDKNDPLGNKNIRYVTNVGESKRLHDKTGPMIIISASGTCEHGRIQHHLKNNIENPYNTIIIVGYMPENTLGRKISERKPSVNIFGRPYKVKAEVAVVDAFSAHADKNDLLSYAKSCKESLKRVFLVHGEPRQTEILRKSLKSLDIQVTVPKKNETVYLKS